MIKLYTTPVLLQVVYYMPKHPMLVQEFIWGYYDIVPELSRTHKFLNFWKTNIDAVINSVTISIANEKVTKIRSIDALLRLN